MVFLNQKEKNQYNRAIRAINKFNSIAPDSIIVDYDELSVSFLKEDKQLIVRAIILNTDFNVQTRKYLSFDISMPDMFRDIQSLSISRTKGSHKRLYYRDIALLFETINKITKIIKGEQNNELQRSGRKQSKRCS